MRSRTGMRAAWALVVVAVALAFGLTRAATRATPAAAARRPVAPGPAPSATAAPAAPDPRQLRDVFRFADEVPARPRAEHAAGPVEAAPVSPVASATPPPGPRLVGLLRRSGALVAVLSLDGEVELAAPGQSAAGVTVLAVGEDGVRVRRSDGGEETLRLAE